MKITTKIVKNGSSIYILVPKELAPILELEAGNIVSVDIKKIAIQEDSPIKSYRCKVCQYQFDTDSKDLFCPACGDETSCEEVIEDD